MTFFLDSNVFLYAIGAEHPLREPCRAIVRAVGEGSLGAATSAEVVQEVMHVLARRGMTAAAADAARGILGLFPSLLAVDAAVVRRAADLLRGTPGLRVRDAIHAATMRGAGLDAIVTADREFDRMPGVRRIDPSEGHRLPSR